MPEWFIARSGRPLPVTWSARSLEGTGGTLLTFHDASTDGLAVTGRSVQDPRHPWGTVTDGVYHDRKALRRAILDRIRERCADPTLSTAHLAAEFHISVRSLQVIMAEAGHSPATTIRQMRLELACRLLAEGTSVSEAGRASGFRDPGTFARAFRRAYGTSPGVWRFSGADTGIARH
jgi:AraC-like DNA-binding protein